MYLSLLLIDVGSNPDRPRPGRMWLRNLYRVHQRLCMAFPSASQEQSDGHFLGPFRPEQFAQGHVHVQRSGDAGFLFRVDPRAGGRCAISVLSALEPKWDYAFRNAGHFLAGPPQTRPFSPTISTGARFAFRLQANAVFRARRQSVYRAGIPISEKWVGKRVGVPGDEKSARAWLERRAAASGFALVRILLARPGYIRINGATGSEKGQNLRSMRYEGVLAVTDADLFRRTLVAGIGPAKAFGFGLLSIAPVKPEP